MTWYNWSRACTKAYWGQNACSTIYLCLLELEGNRGSAPIRTTTLKLNWINWKDQFQKPYNVWLLFNTNLWFIEFNYLLYNSPEMKKAWNIMSLPSNRILPRPHGGGGAAARKDFSWRPFWGAALGGPITTHGCRACWHSRNQEWRQIVAVMSVGQHLWCRQNSYIISAI